MKKSILIYISLFLLLFTLAFSEDHITSDGIRLPHFDGESGKQVTPLFTTKPPVIDGKLDDMVWKECAQDGDSLVRDFTYRGMEERHEHAEQTLVYTAMDSENLYFGIECYMGNTDEVISSLLIRDAPIWIDDSVEIFLDTFDDDKSAYYIMVSVDNIQLDGYISEEGEVENRNWDGVWYSEVSIDRDAWYAEIKLPIRNLRFGLFNDNWGFNVVRFHAKENDQSTWKMTGDNVFRVSMFGDLLDMNRISKRPTVDVIPYGSIEYRDLAKNDETTIDYKGGIDVSTRIIPSTIIGGTYKPDFAQVEADPYQINLTDEELFVPEKRPYFLEGQQYFDTPIQTFYSRRIGDIEYGGKLLGRVGPTHLYALSLRAYENLEDVENEGSPYMYDYLVGRVKQDITKYAFLGVLGVERTGEHWGSNRSLSVDAGVSFNDELIFSGQFTRAQDVELQLQESAYDISISRYTGGLSFGGGYIDLGRRLDIIKTGYIPYDDAKGYWGWSSYDWWLWGLGIKKVSFYADYEHYDNHDGSVMEKGREFDSDSLQREGYFGEMKFSLENKMSFRISGERNFRRMTGRVYTPDPIDVKLVYDNYSNEYYTLMSGYNLEEWNSAYIFYMIGQHFGYDLNYWGAGITVSPIKRLSIDYSMDYEILEDASWWYVERTPQHRVKVPVYYHYEYIINKLYLTYSITDTVQARLFFQSSSDVGHFATNALISWEYLPGSHAYLVYNEKRLFKQDRIDDVGRSVLDQIVFFKLNYYLGL